MDLLSYTCKLRWSIPVYQMWKNFNTRLNIRKTLIPSWTGVYVILEAVKARKPRHVSLRVFFTTWENLKFWGKRQFDKWLNDKMMREKKYLNHRRLNLVPFNPIHSFIEAPLIGWLMIHINVHIQLSITNQHLHTHQEDRHCLNLFQQYQPDRRSCNLSRSICRKPSGSVWGR